MATDPIEVARELCEEAKVNLNEAIKYLREQDALMRELVESADDVLNVNVTEMGAYMRAMTRLRAALAKVKE